SPCGGRARTTAVSGEINGGSPMKLKPARLRPRSRLRRGWAIVLGLLLLPAAFWVTVLAVIPTDGARRRIAERLSAASGRRVQLGGLRVGPLGGVSLTGLEIGAPDSADDPWLRLAEARIDVSLLQLLFGHVEP